MVEAMIGRDCSPVWAITDRLRPKPSRITAYCRIFFEVKLMPAVSGARARRNGVMAIPSRMENTGPPTTGARFPRNQAMIAMLRHSAIPGRYF